MCSGPVEPDDRQILLRVTDRAAGSAAPAPPIGATVTILGVTQILAWGSSYYLLAVLAGTIARESGWSLSWVVGGLSLGLAVAGLVSPFLGERISHGHGRLVLASSSLLLAVGLTLLGLSTSLVVYLAAWAVMGMGMGAGLYDAAFATLGTLFGKDARRAITALTLFGGFASTVCWPLSAFLLEHFGWRGVCFAYASIQLGISLPLHALLLPTAVRRRPLSVEHSETPQRLVAPGQLLPFVVLAAAIALAALISTTISVHLLTVLEAKGVILAAAVGLGAMVGPAQVSARVVEMLFGRNYHPIWTKLAATTLVTAGLMLLLLGFPFLAIGLVLYGCGIGIESIARGTLPLALFGVEGYGARLGRLALPSLIAQAGAPFLGAVLLQHGGADLALKVLAGLATANVGLVVVLLVLRVRKRLV